MHNQQKKQNLQRNLDIEHMSWSKCALEKQIIHVCIDMHIISPRPESVSLKSSPSESGSLRSSIKWALSAHAWSSNNDKKPAWVTYFCPQQQSHIPHICISMQMAPIMTRTWALKALIVVLLHITGTYSELYDVCRSDFEAGQEET